MPGPDQKPASFFHFVDRDGQDHVVDRLEEVPAEYRDKELRMAMGASAAPTPAPRAAVRETPLDAWHAPSFVLGAAAVLVVMVVAQLVRGMAGRLVVRTLLMGAVVMVLGVAWITVLQNKVREGAGLPPSLSPTQAIDDAKHAKDELNKQSRATEKALQHLDP